MSDPRAGVKATTCPTCGYRMDAATATRGKARPRPGDFSLCLYCGQALRFDEQLEPVLAVEADMLELADAVPSCSRFDLLEPEVFLAEARAELERKAGEEPPP